MILIPAQYFGLGDIMFEITLVRQLVKEFNCNAIVWPCMGEHVDALNYAYPDIQFVDYKKSGVDFPHIDFNRKDDYINAKEGYHYLPLRWADQILKLPYTQCMAAKYMLYGKDWRKWKEQAYWRRNMEKETRLHADILGIKKDEPYILANMIYGAHCHLKRDLNLVTNARVIEMRPIPGVSMFDWGYTMQCASDLYFVSSSMLYFVEMLSVQANLINVFAREPENHLNNVRYLFSKDKPYILREG